MTVKSIRFLRAFSVLAGVLFLSSNLQAQFCFEPAPCQLTYDNEYSHIIESNGLLMRFASLSGIWVSSDAGHTWNYAGMYGMGVKELIPMNDSTYFCGATNGSSSDSRFFYITHNRGKSWDYIGFVTSLKHTEKCYASDTDEVLFIDDSDVYRWRNDFTSLDTMHVGTWWTNRVYKMPDHRYIALCDSGGLSELRISVDDGVTWQRSSLLPPNLFTRDMLMTPSGVLYLERALPGSYPAPVTIRRSDDYGDTWYSVVDSCAQGTMLIDPSNDEVYLTSAVDRQIIQLIDPATRTTRERSIAPFSIFNSSYSVGNFTIDAAGIWHQLDGNKYYRSSDKYAGFTYVSTIMTKGLKNPFIRTSPVAPDEFAFFDSDPFHPSLYGITEDFGETTSHSLETGTDNIVSYQYDIAGTLHMVSEIEPTGRIQQCQRYDKGTHQWTRYGAPFEASVSSRLYFGPGSNDFYRTAVNGYAGFDWKLYRSTDDSQSWQPLHEGDSGSLNYFTVLPNGRIFSAINRRIQWMDLPDPTWTIEPTMKDTAIYMIESDDAGYVHALGRQAIFRYDPATSDWKEFYRPLRKATFIGQYTNGPDPGVFDVNGRGDVFVYEFDTSTIHFYNASTQTWSVQLYNLLVLRAHHVVLLDSRRVLLSTYYGLLRGKLLHDAVTEVPPSAEMPFSFLVRQNYPNPFNPGTQIEYELPATAAVTIQVTDALGRTVLTADEGSQSAGVHSWHADLTGRPNGLYFYTVRAGDAVQTKKMMLVK